MPLQPMDFWGGHNPPPGSGGTTGFVCARDPAVPSLSGVKFWGAIDRQAGLSDGDPVSTFTDQSGNGNHATSSGSNRPVYTAAPSGGTGKPGLKYTPASSTKLIVPSLTYNPSSFTVALVAQPYTNDAGILFEFTDIGSCYCFGDTGSSLKQSRGGTISAKEISSGWWYTAKTQKLLTVAYDGTHAGHTARLNKAALSTSDTTVNDPGTGSLTSVLHLGSRNGSLVNGWYLYEVWVVSPALGSTDRDALEAYLWDRWCLDHV